MSRLKGVSINSDSDLNRAIYEKNLKEIIGEPALRSDRRTGDASKIWSRPSPSYADSMTDRIQVFEQMLEADPSNTMVMFGLAKEYEKLGQHADVIRVLERLFVASRRRRKRVRHARKRLRAFG